MLNTIVSQLDIEVVALSQIPSHNLTRNYVENCHHLMQYYN